MSNILIVEDEEITAFALELFCQKLGYSVIETVSNYEDALKVLHKEKIDLIIADIKLNSQRTGLDVAIVAEEKYDTSTIFLTAYYDEVILKQAKHINFYGYIMKPYKEDELEATIKLALYQIEKNRTSKERYIEVCDYIFDMEEIALYDDEKEVHLSKKGKRLFYFLANHLGETKAYTEIIDYVYEGEEVSLDTLRHLIKRIRALTHKECISASRNFGYSLNSQVI